MKFVLIVLLWFVTMTPVFGANEIMINEFVIEDTGQRVEIFNTGENPADISHWYLDDSGGTTYFTIPANTLIEAHKCVVISGEFNLNKSSADTLRFFNNTAPPTAVNAQLIDSFSYPRSPGTTISYVRVPDGTNTWTTAETSLGKFNTSKESCLPLPTPTVTEQPTPTVTPFSTPQITPTPTILPPEETISNVYISEAMTYPDSGEQEWVEIYNNNDFLIELDGWHIDDAADSGGSPRSFSVSIEAKEYAVIELTSSLFNNEGDEVRLLDEDEQEIDTFTYESSKKSTSMGRSSSDQSTICIQLPSPGNSNNPCEEQISPTTKPSPTKKITPTKVPTGVKTPTPPKTKTSNDSADDGEKESDEEPMYISEEIPPEQNNELVNQPQVLGTTRQLFSAEKDQSWLALMRSLIFTSSSFSISAILSIAVKLKLGNG